MKKNYWIICFALISLISCKNDKKQTSSIVGHWNLTYGEMNGREAPSLEKIYFDFGEENMRTNFTVTETDETSTYDLKENTLTQNTPEPVIFTIDVIRDSVIEMSTALRGLDFRLVLKRE